MRYLYTILFYLSMPFILLRLFWRARRSPGYRQRLAERFGCVPYQFSGCIWVHAVSVGETIAAIPFIKALKQRYPDLPLVVTNMTPTGAARVKAAFGDSVYQVYIPYDLPDAVSRFLSNINPKIAILMETELWPNLLAACKARKIPIMLANARLSAKSLQTYQYIKSISHEMLSTLDVIAAQAKADAERFIALGATSDKVYVVGNIKFDLTLENALLEKAKLLREKLGHSRSLWIAASTHPGEEEIILLAHQLLLKKCPNALLILVPRHPERFADVAKLIEAAGFSYVKRSENASLESRHAVYLGDTMGELMLLYAASDIAFVGGSFVTIGGHNMIEPAAVGLPILTGPSYFNFAEVSQKLFDAKGMKMVNNQEELATQLFELFSHPDEKQKMGEFARDVVDNNRGSLATQVQLVEQLLSSEK